MCTNRATTYAVDDATAACNAAMKDCRAADGVRRAYTISGSGPFLVKTGKWMNILNTIGKARFGAMSFRRPVARTSYLGSNYVARGNGMSDWDVDALSSTPG